MTVQLEIVIGIASTIIAISAIIISIISYRREQRTAIREATEVIYREWWSEDLHSLRRYFHEEFLPKHMGKLLDKSIKDIEIVVPEDKSRVRQYCYFFDKVGWLGAAGLIDVDYIMAPMQHYLRRTWIAMKPLITRSRVFTNERPYDPVYQWGFEWLYLRSNQKIKHQARILKRIFTKPSILEKREYVQLMKFIDKDEENYKDFLDKLVEDNEVGKKASIRAVV